MKRYLRPALAAIALTALMGSTACDSARDAIDRGSATDATAKDKAIAAAADNAANLVADLCPLGAAFVQDIAASASPILAASLRAAAEASCAGLVGLAQPASTAGLPAYCSLPPIAAGEGVTADEATTFNTLRARRCG